MSEVLQGLVNDIDMRLASKIFLHVHVKGHKYHAMSRFYVGHIGEALKVLIHNTDMKLESNSFRDFSTCICQMFQM